MENEIDLKAYRVRSDLLVDSFSGVGVNDGVIVENRTVDDIDILDVVITEDNNKLNKKKGKYVTITYQDVTDKVNRKKLEGVLVNELKEMFNTLNIQENDKCLVVGLGNSASTPDALGPKTVDKILVTRYLYEIENIQVDSNYRNVSSFIPGVTGNTGIESSDVILGIVEKTKPDFIIVIDALASSSIDRVNKTIQMTDSGIHPGSGVYNNRKELSYETLRVPVISIGVPTVIEAFVLVSDTIKYLLKHFSYNKVNYNKNKLIPVTMRDYKKHNEELSEDEKIKLLGNIGMLTENEIRELIFEVLTPIGYNMMVTPKEVDFVIDKTSEVLANSINKALHKKFDI